MLNLRDLGIALYRHFYRQKTSAFAGAGDGPVLRESYSCLSIVNDRQHRGSICPRETRWLQDGAGRVSYPAPGMGSPYAVGELFRTHAFGISR